MEGIDTCRRRVDNGEHQTWEVVSNDDIRISDISGGAAT